MVIHVRQLDNCLLDEHEPMEQYTLQYVFCKYNLMCNLTNIAHICNVNLPTRIAEFEGNTFLLCDALCKAIMAAIQIEPVCSAASKHG